MELSEIEFYSDMDCVTGNMIPNSLGNAIESGNAGTGKSFLVKLLIEAVKLIKIKSGDDLKKPPVIVMAPTANASFIIGGKTIDSALGFFPHEGNRYTQATAGKMAMMKYQLEDVHVVFCDEISMVGSNKLLKINYRLQDLVDENRCQEYMGGISFVASGKYINSGYV